MTRYSKCFILLLLLLYLLLRSAIGYLLTDYFMIDSVSFHGLTIEDTLIFAFISLLFGIYLRNTGALLGKAVIRALMLFVLLEFLSVYLAGQSFIGA